MGNMEGLEIHPVLTRIVCLNQPHLKPWWITQGLSMKLQCFYNPHQPQVIWKEVPLRLPTPRILRIKGHTSHALPSAESPSIKVDVQMGTYLMFYIPKTNTVWSSCQLILNGIQSVSEKTDNPSSFSIQLDHATREILSPKAKPTQNSNELSLKNHGGDNAPQRPADDPGWATRETEPPPPRIKEDFRSSLVVTTIVEEEEAVPSDQDSDSSEDIHKLVIRRMVVNLSPLMTEWQKLKHDDNILVLSLKPQEKGQAWQFISSWISVREKGSEEVSASTLTRRKGVTRPKPSTANSPNPQSPSPSKLCTTQAQMPR